MTKVPQTVINGVIQDMQRDPGLPRANPTEAFWQLPPAQNSTIQSEKLHSETTYAIVGSGITACSVAQNLLENLPKDSTATVSIFEARALTSGATGRNGGHLLSPLPEEFHRMEKGLGSKEATKVARFANRTLEKMYEVANKQDAELQKAAEVRRVRTVTAFRDHKMFKNAKSAHARYESCVPEAKGDHQAFDGEETLQKFNMKDMVGAVESSAGAFWPYRLITGLFARMQIDYPDRVWLETQTPVTQIRHDVTSDSEYPYIVSTPRGEVRASTVIYCSNGWTGHLLPKLRGKIYPVRGTMSTQAVPSNFPREGDQKSWSVVWTPTYDEKDGTLSAGLYYITQNADTGDFYIGGEKQDPAEFFSGDDTAVSTVSGKELEGILPTFFANGWNGSEPPEVRKLWSGIMGFTPDFLPWVGQIPSSITGREGNGEWIAAGFNGYGMPLCWGCGEAVAKSILGKQKEVRDWLPDSFVISPRRLKSPFSTPEVGIALMVEQLPPLAVTVRLVASWLVQKLSDLVSPKSRA